MFGLPGGSSGGGPVGSLAFWLAIGLAALAVTALVGVLFSAISQIE